MEYGESSAFEAVSGVEACDVGSRSHQRSFKLVHDMLAGGSELTCFGRTRGLPGSYLQATAAAWRRMSSRESPSMLSQSQKATISLKPSCWKDERGQRALVLCARMPSTRSVQKAAPFLLIPRRDPERVEAPVIRRTHKNELLCF